jgi:Four helix bundle sensory module for signal transduction
MVLSIAIVCAGACGGQPALVRQVEKVGLVNSIQQRLLESVEAEKSAVLAVTDEESAEFAARSKRSAEEIDQLKTRLAELIAADARPDEVEKLGAFAPKWDELKAIDARLLELAVANTNLKAAHLLAHEGSVDLDRFITSVDAMMLACSDVAVVRSLATAATAVARIQSLLLVHIPEASDAEMTTIEERIRRLGATVDAALREAGTLAPSTATGAADAAQAWADYQRVAAEVIRLSRLNTNVISVDVSIHEKRTATRACLDALADLRSAIQGGPHPTR